MTLRKAVVMAAGRGTRMQRAAASVGLSGEQERAAVSGAKAMMPVGRPFLDYVLSGLADAGVDDVCIVVAADDTRIRERYMHDVRPTRLRLHVAVQASPRGTADAVRTAREFAGDDAFLALNADNYYPIDAVRTLAAGPGAGVAAFDPDALVALGNVPRERLAAFALLRTARDGTLATIVEKPDGADLAAEPRARISMNLWAFTPAFFAACDAIAPSARGELELADAVTYSIRTLGARFAVYPFALGVLDLSTRADVAAVAERLRDVEVRL